MARVLVPLVDGVEEIEAVTIIDVLRRAGVEVVCAGLTEKPVTASRKVKLVPDRSLEEAKDEAFDILNKAEEAGLVLQPENSQRPHYICCCCGDCCAILTTVKKFPCPAEFYATNYYSVVDADLCNGCETCVDICQLDALEMVNDVATVNRDRCIGCGNCVATCTSNAIHLQKKEEELLPPVNTKTLYMNIMSRK